MRYGQFLAAFGLLSFFTVAYAQPRYALTDIGMAAGVSGVNVATDINNAGQITGSMNQPGHAFLWSPGTPTATILDLGALNPGSFTDGSSGAAINSSGQIVGFSSYNPYIWSPGGTMVSLGNLPLINRLEASANAVNDYGQVVITGWDFSNLGGYKSVLWKPSIANGSSGTVVTIGGGGGVSMSVFDIASNGDVVGSGTLGGFLWRPTTPNGLDGTFHPLGHLAGGSGAAPSEINASGQIVGTGSTATSEHAFLWTPSEPNGTNGLMIDLGTLSGGTDVSHAEGINSFGVIVGESGGISNQSVPSRAFVWTASDHMMDLITLVDETGTGWTLQGAYAINDSGMIVGQGLFDPDGIGGVAPQTRAYLLTPIPEPNCAVALVALLFILLCCRSHGSAAQRMTPRHAGSTVNRFRYL